MRQQPDHPGPSCAQMAQAGLCAVREGCRGCTTLYLQVDIEDLRPAPPPHPSHMRRLHQPRARPEPK